MQPSRGSGNGKNRELGKEFTRSDSSNRSKNNDNKDNNSLHRNSSLGNRSSDEKYCNKSRNTLIQQQSLNPSLVRDCQARDETIESLQTPANAPSDAIYLLSDLSSSSKIENVSQSQFKRRQQPQQIYSTSPNESNLANVSTPTIINTIGTKASSNLSNLANIDHQAFFNQQQQLRAELQLKQQNQHQSSGLSRPAGSPSSIASTECLTSLSVAPAGNTPSSLSSSSMTTTSSSSGVPSGYSRQAKLGSTGVSPANELAPLSPEPQSKSEKLQQEAYNPSQGAIFFQQQQQQHTQHHHPFTMSKSDTTDDIQSLTSQFNIHCSTSGTVGVGAQGQQGVVCTTSSSFIQGHGHYFTKKTFHKPTYCHHCADMLWGLIGQGYICEVCNFVVHERCMKMVVSSCSTVASSTIKNPMAHCWTDTHAKRKFCNVCRKRIEDNTNAARCSVCEYCVHLECQEFSISDCRECATYVPDQSLNEVKQHHHWREGNLPQIGSKCYWCKKSCFSVECLTGMRCEWCQMTVHASCLKNITTRDCNLGSLQSIMLPPYCVSIPRTDVPMETIIGVSNRVNLGNTSSTTNFGFGPGSPNLQMYSSPDSGNFTQRVAGLAGRRDNLTPRSISEDFCHQQQMQMNAPTTGSTLYHQQQLLFQQQQPESDYVLNRDKDEEWLRVYDGNGSLKKRSFRQIAVHKSINKENLISRTLRAFYIHDDTSYYNLYDISSHFENTSQQQQASSSALVERELDENYPLIYLPSRISSSPANKNLGQQMSESASGGQLASSASSLSSGATSITTLSGSQASSSKQQISHSKSSSSSSFEPISLLLRYRPPDSSRGVIKVFPGRLNFNAELPFCNISVTNDTSVSDIMEEALEKFRLRTRETNLNRYRLVEVSLDKGSAVHERTMDNSECPWEIIKNVARDSLRQKENTRFYLQQQDEVYCSSVAIFVGNLPSNLSQKQYESMLMEQLGKPYRFKSINPIYYEYGSCIITYDNADIAVKAFYRLREASIRWNEEIRVPVVLLLPNIVPEMVPEGVRPLLVFVNVKSGGCQGLDLITNFRRLLNPYQVYDLENGGPLPGLYVFRKIRDYKILVSGGDGSVGWVLQCLDNVGQDSVCQSPPCAIIPLGTGNDLARVLRWGSGYTGAEDPITFLKDVTDAEEVILDRWTVVFHSDEATNKQDYPSALSISSTAGTGGTEDNAAIFVMNNYLGIGLDADLCLGFHNAREENPDKFNSRLHNKGVYVKQAIKKMVNRGSWNDLKKSMRLEVDGKVIPMPHVEGIIILNILSWGSGANPWGPETDDRFAKPTHYDGMLEVVGITGIVHMGQIQSGLSRAIRIAQGGRIKIRLNTDMPIQVDGEPWIQPACEMNIIRSALKATMLRKIKMKRRNTEPSINQLIEKGLTAPDQSQEVMQ